jgi:hypothetical protein
VYQHKLLQLKGFSSDQQWRGGTPRQALLTQGGSIASPDSGARCQLHKYDKRLGFISPACMRANDVKIEDKKL